MQEGNDKMTDLIIDWLIYRQMYELDRAWKTVTAVRKGLKDLKYNKENGGFEGQYPNALFGYGKG